MQNDGCYPVYRIESDITQGDSIIFANAIHVIKDQYHRLCNEKNNRNKIIFQLNSIGGDVEEAIKIGRILRKNEILTVTVPPDGECLSSCVFILSAGIRRTVWGKVGIHRPYFPSLSTDENILNIKHKRESILTSIKQYLEEMDVNPSLVDTMLSIPPDELKILTPDELSYYRLTGLDANYEEKFIAQAASSYGLTSYEYRKRSAAVEEYCILYARPDQTARFTLCREAILLDIFEDRKNARLQFYSDKIIKDKEKVYQTQCADELPANEKKECFTSVLNFKMKK